MTIVSAIHIEGKWGARGVGGGGGGGGGGGRRGSVVQEIDFN